MAQSSSTVFVIVEHDVKPAITATLKDANGNTVSRASFNVTLVVRPVAGGAATRITASWADSPTNTRPTVAWTSANRLSTGVYYGEWETDPNGTAEWTFPTEDPFTIVVRAGMG
jgi:hypothetical protein